MLARSAGTNRRRPSDAALSLAGLAPDRVVALDAADERARLVELLAHRALRALEEQRDPAGVEDVERARLEAPPAELADDARRVARLDDERRGALRQRMEAQRDARDEREPPLGAADELPEVVAGDVLHDLAARARDRAVAEDERHAQHEVARGAEAMRERPGEPPGEAGPDRRVAGRVEREALTGGPERLLQRREPDPGLDRAGEVAGLVLEHPSEPVGLEVRADAHAATGRARLGEIRSRLLDRRRSHQKRSARPSRSRGWAR